MRREAQNPRKVYKISHCVLTGLHFAIHDTSILTFPVYVEDFGHKGTIS